MKLAAVVGARPQFMKAAPVSWVVRGRTDVSQRLIATGQHYDPEMSSDFFAELDLPEPDVHLGISGGGHGAMTGRMLEALEQVLLDDRPDVVVVYGDTNSTLAAALAAAKLVIPVAHVEAGLRSFREGMPEEINRVVTDHLSAFLYCPTGTAVRHLAREGLERGVVQVGDVMYDLARVMGERSEESAVLDRHGLEPDGYSVATVHRAENTDDPGALQRVLTYLSEQDGPVVLPLHPRTREAIQGAGLSTDGLVVTGPVGYLDMTRLVRSARTVYTDSGGLQKEAYFHGTPCVTLRDETEWVETVEHGWNRLWTVDHYRERRPITEYGDGHAATRIVDHLATALEARS